VELLEAQQGKRVEAGDADAALLVVVPRR